MHGNKRGGKKGVQSWKEGNLHEMKAKDDGARRNNKKKTCASEQGGGGAQKGLNWGYAKRRMNTPSYSMRHMFCGFCPREIRHCQIAGTNKHAFNLQLREHGMRRQRGCWEGSFVSIPEGDVIAPRMPGTIGIFCITMAADPRNIDSLMQEVLSTDTFYRLALFFQNKKLID